MKVVPVRSTQGTRPVVAYNVVAATGKVVASFIDRRDAVNARLARVNGGRR